MGRQSTEFKPRKRGAGSILDYYGALSWSFDIAASGNEVQFFGPFLPGAVLTALRFQFTCSEAGQVIIRAGLFGHVPKEADFAAGSPSARQLILPAEGEVQHDLDVNVLGTTPGMYEIEIPILKRSGVGTEFVGANVFSISTITTGHVTLA